MQAVRALLLEYGEIRRFDVALGDFEGELAGLPGKYVAPEGGLLLATWEGLPAGCVAFRRIDTTHCEMKRLFVRPAYRGKGLGQALVAAVVAAARAAGYGFMRLDTHPSMQAALALYQAAGFIEIDRYNDNPTPDIRFFELELEAKST